MNSVRGFSTSFRSTWQVSFFSTVLLSNARIFLMRRKEGKSVTAFFSQTFGAHSFLFLLPVRSPFVGRKEGTTPSFSSSSAPKPYFSILVPPPSCEMELRTHNRRNSTCVQHVWHLSGPKHRVKSVISCGKCCTRIRAIFRICTWDVVSLSFSLHPDCRYARIHLSLPLEIIPGISSLGREEKETQPFSLARILVLRRVSEESAPTAQSLYASAVRTLRRV